MPKNVDAINITMGYPLKDIPTTSLLFSIFQLFISQEKLQKSVLNEFYYKDVIRFFKHQSIYGLLAKIDHFTEAIAKDNQTFITKRHIEDLLKEEKSEVKNIILKLFEAFDSVENFMDRILALIDLLKAEVNPLEKEYLFRFYTVFTQLQTLQNEFH